MRTKLLSLAVGVCALSASAHPIDFDQIRNWTGTGPNRAALVIQFNGDLYGPDTYVWGYRWEDGENPSGETMMKAVCANSSRLSMLTQFTGSMGSTLCGVGYSLNQEILRHLFFNFEKAQEFEFINFDYYNVNTFMGQTQAPGDDAPEIAQEAIDNAIAGSHYIQHPFDYHTYGYPAYDYDCWDIDEETENMVGCSPYEPKWLSAWYEGYWSYWCANSPAQEWMYSGTGFTGRSLVDGSVDGWSFTEFESAMVGGFGEGVAPCEDGGAIFYMPEKLPSVEVDASRCVRSVGDGVLSLPLIVRFSDPMKADNLVVSLNFYSVLPSAGEVLEVLARDPAFSLEGKRLSLDLDGDGVFNSSRGDVSAEGEWQLTEYEDCAILSCGEDSLPKYLIYMPEGKDAPVVIPDELTYRIKDVEGDVIVLNPKQMIGVIVDPAPGETKMPDFNVSLEGAGSSKDEVIATMYKVNYWNETNTRIQFYELSGHRAGECTLTLTSKDGSRVPMIYTVKVEEQDRTPLDGGYLDGTLLLNEEWFGHTNGGMNYLTPEGEMMYQVYERENPGMSFGCTSQYAAIWGDRLIAVSKQAVDAGDPLPGGGRVVVADAKTLRRLGSIDDLKFGDETKSADGRTVVGATPQKVYVGTSNGIYIVDLDEIKVIGKITDFDEEGGASDLYSGQIGDLVNAGRYVFGIKQATGAFVIDTETDRVIRKYPMTTVQGITQTADGNVWIASTVSGCGRFTCIDPVTLEEREDMSVTLPSTVSYPTCTWGAWRNTPFVGSKGRNTIWFSTGGGIAGGSAKDKYYGWDVGSDPELLTPVFDMAEANLTGSNARVNQKTYGTLRYDDRSGELIVMTTENSASGHYRYNWTHFVKPETGEIVRTIALRPYYWFQAFAIFPDKYAPVIALEDFSLDIPDGEKVIDLSELVCDEDNIDSNIILTLLDAQVDAYGENHAGVRLEGKTLTLTPKTVGNHYFTLEAQSNGRTVSKTITVKVTDTSTGIAPVSGMEGKISCDGKRLYLTGFGGRDFRIFDVAGQQVAGFRVDSDNYTFDFGAHDGIYVVNSGADVNVKVMIRK